MAPWNGPNNHTDEETVSQTVGLPTLAAAVAYVEWGGG